MSEEFDPSKLTVVKLIQWLKDRDVEVPKSRKLKQYYIDLVNEQLLKEEAETSFDEDLDASFTSVNTTLESPKVEFRTTQLINRKRPLLSSSRTVTPRKISKEKLEELKKQGIFLIYFFSNYCNNLIFYFCIFSTGVTPLKSMNVSGFGTDMSWLQSSHEETPNISFTSQLDESSITDKG